MFFKQTAKQRSVYICVVNSVELDYSYLHLFQVCPAVYIWRKSIGNGAQTSAEFFQCEGKGSHYMFLFAIIPILKYTNFKISLYEAEGCVFLFFFNIPQYSVIFYNIQQYFILAKNSNARLREISISIIYSHSQYRETFVWSIKEDIICFVCSESNWYMLCFCAVMIRYM